MRASPPHLPREISGRGERPAAAGASALPGALFAALLPTAEETTLARVALAEGEAARQAWTLCQEPSGDLIRSFREDSRGLKRWAPLLEDSLRRHRLPVPAALSTMLRAAAFQEELRTREYRRIVGEILSRLRNEAVEVLVLKGLALAELVYPRPALRHSHDLELLVRRPDDLDRAVTALGRLGARTLPPVRPLPTGAVLLQHGTGLPIGLQTSVFRAPHHDVSTEILWSRRSSTALAGVPANVLAPDDMLLHVLGHTASGRSRTPLQWVADAWFLLQRHPDLDWARLLRTAQEGHLRLALAAMLPYLAREVGAVIPVDVLARATEAARTAPRVERDAMLAAVRSVDGGGLRRLLGALGSRRDRLRLILWLLAPSPAYLRHVHGSRAAALLPILYVFRPVVYAARVMRRGPGR